MKNNKDTLYCRIRIMPSLPNRIKGAKSMLKEAAKQFRLNNNNGHAEMCEMHASLI